MHKVTHEALPPLSVYGLLCLMSDTDLLSDKKRSAVEVAQQSWSNAAFVPLKRRCERKQHAIACGSALPASLPG